MMVEITWSMFGAEDPFAPIAVKQVTLLQDWATCRDNAESAASDIAADYLVNAGIWDDWWGADCSDMEVLVEIVSPPVVAGTYLVEVERVVTARARKAVDPRRDAAA